MKMIEKILWFVITSVGLFLSFYVMSGFQLSRSGLQLFALVSVAIAIMLCAFMFILKTAAEEYMPLHLNIVVCQE